MPTPFLHIPIAYEVAQQLGLQDSPHLPSFLLGSATADIAQVRGRPRGETHFWHLDNDVSGTLRLLATHPELEAARLDGAARLYVAGYLCHLVADEQWTFCIWRPYFGKHTKFGGSAEGAALQNAFRDVLDSYERGIPPGTEALTRLVEEAPPVEAVLPPFVAVEDLADYRRRLVERLLNPREVPEGGLHAEGWAYVRPESVAEFRQRAREESVTLLLDYLDGNALRPPIGTVAPDAT